MEFCQSLIRIKRVLDYLKDVDLINDSCVILVIEYIGEYLEIDCGVKRPFICSEVRSSAVWKKNEKLGEGDVLPLMEAQQVNFNCHSVTIHPKKKSFKEANKICKNEGIKLYDENLLEGTRVSDFSSQIGLKEIWTDFFFQ